MNDPSGWYIRAVAYYVTGAVLGVGFHFWLGATWWIQPAVFSTVGTVFLGVGIYMSLFRSERKADSLLQQEAMNRLVAQQQLAAQFGQLSPGAIRTGGAVSITWPSPLSGYADIAPRPPIASRDAFEGELFIGWRHYGFELVRRPLEPKGWGVRLHGNVKPWEGRELKAVCEHGDLERCLSGATGETPCGIHAWKHPPDIAIEYAVMARCSLDGTVAVHELGYRASEVRIDRIWFVTDRPWINMPFGNGRAEFRPSDFAALIAAEYGVPAEVVTREGWKQVAELWNADR